MLKINYTAHLLIHYKKKFLINIIFYMFITLFFITHNNNIIECMHNTESNTPTLNSYTLNVSQDESIENNSISNFELDDTVSDFDPTGYPLEDITVFEAYPTHEYSLGYFLGHPLPASTNPYWCCFLTGIFYVPLIISFGVMGYLCITVGPCIITGVYATAVAEEPALQIFQYNFHSCVNYTEGFVQSLF